MVIHKPLQTHPPKCEVKSLLSIADPPVLEQDNRTPFLLSLSAPDVDACGGKSALCAALATSNTCVMTIHEVNQLICGNLLLYASVNMIMERFTRGSSDCQLYDHSALMLKTLVKIDVPLGTWHG